MASLGQVMSTDGAEYIEAEGLPPNFGALLTANKEGTGTEYFTLVGAATTVGTPTADGGNRIYHFFKKVGIFFLIGGLFTLLALIGAFIRSMG